MVKIGSLEELVALGNLNKDCLVMATDGVIKFMTPLKIPFSIKVTGDTLFTSASLSAPVHFVGKKAAITSAVSGSSLSFKNIYLKSDIPLFDIKQNTIERLVLDNGSVNCEDLGLANFKTLLMSEFRFINKDQQALEIGSCNSITALGVTNSSQQPLLELSETKSIRDHLIVHEYRDVGKGGLLSFGIREADKTYLLASIPKRGILAKRIEGASVDLLRVIHEGYYAIPELNVARKYFG